MSFILAKFLGLYFLGVGIAAMANPGRFGKIYDSMKDNVAVLSLSGILALMFGALVVSVHNVWVAGWPVIITILGWWGLIKGVALLAFPGFVDAFSFMLGRSDQFYRGLGVVAALIGLFLAYQGW